MRKSKSKEVSSSVPAAAEKAPKRGESPEEIAKLLTQIEKKEKEVQVAEVELDSRKAAAKSAKSEWLVKVGELRELVRTRERWREEAKRQPLLNQKKLPEAPALPEGAKFAKPIRLLKDLEANGDAIGKAGEIVTAYVDADGDVFLPHYPTTDHGEKSSVMHQAVLEAEEWEDAPADSLEWRKSGIDKLTGEVTPKDLEKLAAANILTLGDLQDRMQKAGQFWFEDISGIGRAGADRVENSFNAFVAANSAS